MACADGAMLKDKKKGETSGEISHLAKEYSLTRAAVQEVTMGTIIRGNLRLH